MAIESTRGQTNERRRHVWLLHARSLQLVFLLPAVLLAFLPEAPASAAWNAPICAAVTDPPTTSTWGVEVALPAANGHHHSCSSGVVRSGTPWITTFVGREWGGDEEQLWSGEKRRGNRD